MSTPRESSAGNEPATPAAIGPEGIPASPFCIHLRTKKSYFLRGPALEAADLEDGSGYCWCRKTMLALGPDGEPVSPSDCRAGRACFETIA